MENDVAPMCAHVSVIHVQPRSWCPDFLVRVELNNRSDGKRWWKAIFIHISWIFSSSIYYYRASNIPSYAFGRMSRKRSKGLFWQAVSYSSRLTFTTEKKKKKKIPVTLDLSIFLFIIQTLVVVLTTMLVANYHYRIPPKWIVGPRGRGVGVFFMCFSV